MSIRSSALKLAGKLRALPSSPGVDIYMTSVTIRTRTWAGGRVNAEGGYSDSNILITPRPKVREVAQREITGAGGRYEAGDVKVGPITPTYSGGGYTIAQLAPTASSNGVEILYVLAGAIAGDYKRIDLQTDRALSYFLILRRKRSSP
jgi:hypothetical protein